MNIDNLEKIMINADEFYNSRTKFYKDMRQDLLAMGKSEEDVIKEFIIDAYCSGYFQVNKNEEIKWKCRRCGKIVDMKSFRCECKTSPSPWEPIVE